jgi:hypothetical protein
MHERYFLLIFSWALSSISFGFTGSKTSCWDHSGDVTFQELRSAHLDQGENLRAWNIGGETYWEASDDLSQNLNAIAVFSVLEAESLDREGFTLQALSPRALTMTLHHVFVSRYDGTTLYEGRVQCMTQDIGGAGEREEFSSEGTDGF